MCNKDWFYIAPMEAVALSVLLTINAGLLGFLALKLSGSI